MNYTKGNKLLALRCVFIKRPYQQVYDIRYGGNAGVSVHFGEKDCSQLHQKTVKSAQISAVAADHMF